MDQQIQARAKNDEQITQSKTRLRGQLKELALKVATLEAEKRQMLEQETIRFQQKYDELQAATSALLTAVDEIVTILTKGT